MKVGDEHQITETDILQDEERKAKRGHVLTELKETEQVYVSELNTILTVSSLKSNFLFRFFLQINVYLGI